MNGQTKRGTQSLDFTIWNTMYSVKIFLLFQCADYVVFRWCEGGKIAILLKNILAVSIMFVFLQCESVRMRV